MIILGTTNPRARKEHQCALCSRTIQPGEQYHRSRIIGDDGPYVFKQCAHCTALVARLNEESSDWCDDGYDSDSVIDFYTDDEHTRALIDAFCAQWKSTDGALVPIPRTATLTEGEGRG